MSAVKSSRLDMRSQTGNGALNYARAVRSYKLGCSCIRNEVYYIHCDASRWGSHRLTGGRHRKEGYIALTNKRSDDRRGQRR